MKEQCKKCRGKGHQFKPGGFTKADIIPCTKCNGTGELKAGSQEVKKKSFSRGSHYKRWDGIELLKLVDDV